MGEKSSIALLMWEYYNNYSKGYKYDFEECSFYIGPEIFHSVQQGLVYSRGAKPELKRQIKKW